MKTMEPQEHIRRAEQLCQRLRNATAQIGPRGRERAIKGVDANELKKLLTFLLNRQNLAELKKLVDALPNSNFARRSGSTAGYYKNIQSALGADFYRLPVEDAIQILGWACRLL